VTRFALRRRAEGPPERPHTVLAAGGLPLGVLRLGLSPTTGRARSARSAADAVLLEQIRAMHGGSRGTYGAPRVHAQLAAAGVCVGRKPVARLMLRECLAGVSRRRWCARCTRRDSAAVPALDLVDRQFVADRPTQLWVADVT
jgi:putative transposase